MKTTRLALLAAIVATLCLPLQAAQPSSAAAPQSIADVAHTERSLAWLPKFAHRSATLRIVGPNGFVLEQDFGAGVPAFDLAARTGMTDGLYRYEVTFGRIPDSALALALEGVHRGDGTFDAALQERVRGLGESLSGSFRVVGGAIVSPDLREAAALKARQDPTAGVAPKVVFAEDAIVQGSLCVGLDCVAGESFGFDTIRLKENNTRIKFEDTSVAPFATNDWQLTANDSASGGLSKFSIDDITGAKTPFTVEAGAATNSIYVDSTGRLGLRTSTPVLDVHANTSNTPALRLEQNNSGGFTAQTWDIGANEANFFIRDVTAGSRLPFRIRPGAPTSSIDINASGHVGIGTGSPNLSGAARAMTLAPPVGTLGYSVLELTGSQDSDTGVGVVRFYNKGGLIAQVSGARTGADNSGSLRFFTSNAGAITEKMRVMPSGFVGIGTTSPATTLHVVGNATITGSLQVSGPCCGPDYVFAPGFKLASIEENAAYMWANRHLPAVGPARTTPDGQAVVDVFAQSKGILEELEKAHIYIGQLHEEIKGLKAASDARDAELREQIAELRRLLR